MPSLGPLAGFPTMPFLRAATTEYEPALTFNLLFPIYLTFQVYMLPAVSLRAPKF